MIFGKYLDYLRMVMTCEIFASRYLRGYLGAPP